MYDLNTQVASFRLGKLCFNLRCLQTNFGDIYIPEGFESPGYQPLTELYGDEFSVSSKPVVVMDAKTIKIPAFTYDGQGGEVYFFAGEGPQPSSKGFIVPDELGYLAPLGIYRWNT